MNLRTLPPFQAAVAKPLSAFLLPIVAGFMLSTPAYIYAESANSYYKHGQQAQTREDYDAAFENFRQAAAKDPKDARYKVALNSVRISASSVHMARGRKLAVSGDRQSALSEFLRAAEIDPSNEAARQEIAKLQSINGELPVTTDAVLPMPDSLRDQITTIGSPVLLKPMSNEPLSLHMSENANIIYQAIGRAAGINVLFDPDYNPKRVQVDLSNVSLLDALRIVGTMSNTFWRPITTNTIFIAQNTPAKRRELDEQAVQTFYLTNVAQQNDLNDVQTAVRSIMPSAKVYAIAGQNAIIMRGTPDELLLAQKIISDIDKPRSEVVVDIAIMEVSKTWEKTLGIAWPTSASVAISTSSSSSTSSTSSSSTPSVYDLKNLKASNLAVSLGSATLNMLLSDSNTSILQNPRLRATDGQKATMKIGSRIPVATGSYSTGTATTTVSSLVNTQFQYIDVGVNIEMTPTIHYGGEVTMKLKVEVSSENGTVTISSVSEPIISQRVVEQTIRLREGEASMLGGIQDHQLISAYSGFPGLSTIPVLKYIFGSKDKKITNDDLVFVLVPHIVRSQDIKADNMRPIDTGSGQTNIDLYHTGSSQTADKPAAPAPPPAPAITPRPTPGVVASPSAEQAAPAALQQMRNSNIIDKPVATAATQPQAAPAAATPPTALSFQLATPPDDQLKAGNTFQIPVTLNSGANLASVPLQLQYDASKMSLTNIAAGNLLNRDGQAVALVHRDDGPGNLTVVASRPPGAPGISGSGVVCILTFQAKAAGAATLTLTRAGIIDAAQQQVQAANSRLNLTIH